MRCRVFRGRIKTDVCGLVLRVTNCKLKNSLPYFDGNGFSTYRSRTGVQKSIIDGVDISNIFRVACGLQQ